MRLVWFEMNGYKRFAKPSKINLNEKLVAIVGPNEAGKTTLLRCLEHFNHQTEFVAKGGSQELSRGIQVEDNKTIAEWTFAIDDEDRAALVDVPEAADARWYSIKKKANGRRYFDIKPRPRRSNHVRKSLQVDLQHLIDNLPQVGDDERSDSWDALVPELRSLAKELKSNADSLSEETKELIQRVSNALVSEAVEFSRLSEQLNALFELESATSPMEKAGSILSDQQPEFLFFSRSDRDLAAEYDIQRFFIQSKPNQGIFREEIPKALNQR